MGLLGDKHTCPRRMNDYGPWERKPNLDKWIKAGGSWTARVMCSFCGSMDPEDFMAGVEDGSYTVGPTDKTYKAYVSTETKDMHGKFYYMHLSKEQRRRFVELLNEKKMKIGYPGCFYVLPYFCVPVTDGE